MNEDLKKTTTIYLGTPLRQTYNYEKKKFQAKHGPIETAVVTTLMMAGFGGGPFLYEATVLNPSIANIALTTNICALALGAFLYTCLGIHKDYEKVEKLGAMLRKESRVPPPASLAF
jgi:hypothetical protein